MKLNEIDLNKLIIFSSVAKHDGYRGASEELSLTRSAISQSITNLEETLGKKLFRRVGARLQLTESAQVFQKEIQQYHQGIQAALAHFAQKSGNVDGRLRIGAYLEFTKSKLMPFIEEYMTAFPKVQVKFVFDSPSRIKSLLDNDKIDLSISIFPHDAKKAIESKKLYQEELVLIARSDLLGHQAKKEQILKMPIIDYYPTHLLFKRWWQNQFDQNLKTFHIVSYAATAEMVFELVKRGLGIGVVPRYVLDRFLKEDKVHIVQPTEKRLFDYVWLSQFQQKDHSSAHKEFVELLYRRLKN